MDEWPAPPSGPWAAGGPPHDDDLYRGPETGYPPPPDGPGPDEWPAAPVPDPAGYAAPAALRDYGPGPGGPRRRRRPRWLLPAIAAAVLIAGAVIAANSLLPGSHPTAQNRTAGETQPTTPARAAAPPPAITAAGARQVLAHYVSVNNDANRSFSPSILATIEAGPAGRMDASGYQFTAVALRQGTASAYPVTTFARASFFIPRLAGYPRWFVTAGTWTDLTGKPATARGYLLFTQASPAAPWLQVNEPTLTSGAAPQIMISGGYAEAVTAAATGTLAVPPGNLSPDTASWLDHGQAPAGPAFTGFGTLQDQHDEAFWRSQQLPAGTAVSLQHAATTDGVFALRTTGGGALVFYATSATLRIAAPAGQTVALNIPGFYTEGSPVSDATVPYTDMFATYDPPRGQTAALRVIAEASGI